MNALKILSFNIRGAYANDGENIWQRRSKLNVATIQALTPDLIGFQELQLAHLAVYERELPEYDFELGPKYGGSPPYTYPSIFWRAEKMHRLASDQFWLSQTPERHSAAWNTACIRSALILRLELKSGQPLIVANTHLDHISEEARFQGIKLLLQRLNHFNPQHSAELVSGDFNSPPQSQTYQWLLSQGYTDTFSAAGLVDSADMYTFHRFTGQRQPDYGRIDWIMLRGGLKTTSFEIVRHSQPPLYPSDHYPILAQLELATH